MDDPSFTEAIPLRTVLTPDVAEIAALRVIVMAMAAILAKDLETVTGVEAQAWIAHLAETTIEGLQNSTFTDDRGRELRAVRGRAIDYVTAILGAIDFSSSH